MEGIDIMTIKEAIKGRHSVRQYKDMPIAEDLRQELQQLIDECNAQSGLSIQLICDDPACFDTMIAHYGKFSNANNSTCTVQMSPHNP